MHEMSPAAALSQTLLLHSVHACTSCVSLVFSACLWIHDEVEGH